MALIKAKIPARKLCLRKQLAWVWLAGLLIGADGFHSLAPIARAAQSGEFRGAAVVEWLESGKTGDRMRLVEDFGFLDPRGKLWLARKDFVFDSNGFSPAFQSLIGAPFTGAHRKAALLHHYFSAVRSEQWETVHRMFYDAAIASGVAPEEAKLMYMTLFAQGLRWEVRGSTCYSHCHAAAASLKWRPEVESADLQTVADWILSADPPLEQVDERTRAVIQRPGPHLFVQQRR